MRSDVFISCLSLIPSRLQFMAAVRIGSTRAVASAGLVLLTYIVANIRGLRELGVTSTLLALVLGAAVMARFGLDLLLGRLIAISHHHKRQSDADRLMWAGLALSFLAAAVLCLPVWALSTSIANHLVVSVADLHFALFAVPVIAATAVLAAGLRARGYHASGQLFDVGGFALLFSLATVSLWLAGVKASIGAIFLIAALAFGTLAVSMACLVSGKPCVREILAGQSLVFAESSGLIRLAALTVIQYANQWVSVLVAAYLLTAPGAAELAVSQRVSMLLFVLLSVVGNSVSPRYAALHSDKDLLTINRIEKRVRLGLIAATAPALTAMLAWPSLLLGWFGITGEEAETCLRLMAIGQFVNICCGCSAHLLVAIGCYDKVLHASLIGAAVGLGIGLTVGSEVGAIGVALGQAIGIALPAAVAAHAVHRALRHKLVLA